MPDHKLRIGVLGSTRGTDLQTIIDAVGKGELAVEIVLVASDRKNAYILERARTHMIETLFVDYKKYGARPKAEKIIAGKLKQKKAELIILIGFMKILSPYFVNEFRGRIWNIHPSLLPKYAGEMDKDVHAQVIAAGERETGCTLHEVSEEIDAGRIIMQKKVQVAPGETPETLKTKVQAAEQECLLEAIKMVTGGKLVIGQ